MKKKELLSVDKLKNLMSLVWSYVLHHSVALSLSMDPNEFHLIVDSIARGVGYALFASHLNQVVLVGIKSKGVQQDTSSSFWVSKRVLWALDDTKSLLQIRLVVL